MANRYDKTWGENSHEFSPERWIGNKLDEVTEPGAHLPGVYSSMCVTIFETSLVSTSQLETLQDDVWRRTSILHVRPTDDLPYS